MPQHRVCPPAERRCSPRTRSHRVRSELAARPDLLSGSETGRLLLARPLPSNVHRLRRDPSRRPVPSTSLGASATIRPKGKGAGWFTSIWPVSSAPLVSSVWQPSCLPKAVSSSGCSWQVTLSSSQLGCSLLRVTSISAGSSSPASLPLSQATEPATPSVCGSGGHFFSTGTRASSSSALSNQLSALSSLMEERQSRWPASYPSSGLGHRSSRGSAACRTNGSSPSTCSGRRSGRSASRAPGTGWATSFRVSTDTFCRSPSLSCSPHSRPRPFSSARVAGDPPPSRSRW